MRNGSRLCFGQLGLLASAGTRGPGFACDAGTRNQRRGMDDERISAARPRRTAPRAGIGVERLVKSVLVLSSCLFSGAANRRLAALVDVGAGGGALLSRWSARSAART